MSNLTIEDKCYYIKRYFTKLVNTQTLIYDHNKKYSGLLSKFFNKFKDYDIQKSKFDINLSMMELKTEKNVVMWIRSDLIEDIKNLKHEIDLENKNYDNLKSLESTEAANHNQIMDDLKSKLKYYENIFGAIGDMDRYIDFDKFLKTNDWKDKKPYTMIFSVPDSIIKTFSLEDIDNQDRSVYY